MSLEKSNGNPFAEWDRVNTILSRYWSIYEERRKTLTDIEALQMHDDKFKREVQFLIRRSCDPDFHNFLNNRLDYTKEDGRKAGLVIRKHMKQLAKFILFDKFLQVEREYLKLNDPLTGWKDEEYQSYGHLLRMVNRYYPELITTKEEIRQRSGKRKWSNKRKIEDHRQRVVETQFSKGETQQPGVFDKIVSVAMGLDASNPFFDRMHMQLDEMQKTMVSNPIDLSKLLLFKEDILQIIKEIGKNPFLDADIGDTNDLTFNSLVQMLFEQVRLLVELRWFREKSINIQLKIIFKEPRITKYHKKDAAKAVNLSWNWFQDPEKVMSSMIVAGISYIEYRRIPEPRVSRWLIEECLKQLTYNDDDKALAYYNIAMVCQQTNELRLMMSWLKKSLQLWENVGDHLGDIADIYAYMAEYWRLKDPKKYQDFKNRAEGILKADTTSTPRRIAFHYKFFADCAAMFKDKTWETHLYEQGLLHSSKYDSLSNFANWFNQCIGDMESLGERGPQGGFGRFVAPKEMDGTVVSSAFKIWFYDSESGN